MATSSITIELDGLDDIIDLLKEIHGEVFPEDVRLEIGTYIMAMIKKRTMEGKDASESFFQPYSEKYKIFRKKHGHPTNRVNLFFTGSMLSAMTTSSDSESVKVFFMNTSDKKGVRNPNKAFWLNEKRNFFALSESDIDGIIKILEDHYSSLIS